MALTNPYLWDLGGLVVRGTNHLIRGSELSAPPPASGDEREAGDGLNHQWPFNQVCSQKEAAIKNLNNKVQSAPGLVNTPECRDGGPPPSPPLAVAMHLFPLAVPQLYPL